MYHNLLSILRKENYRNRIDIDLTVSIYKNGLINEIYSKKMKWWLTVWPYTVRMIMTIFWHYRYPVHSSSGENSPRMIEHSWLTNVTFTAMRTDDKTKSWFNKKKKKNLINYWRFFMYISHILPQVKYMKGLWCKPTGNLHWLHEHPCTFIKHYLHSL